MVRPMGCFRGWAVRVRLISRIAPSCQLVRFIYLKSCLMNRVSYLVLFSWCVWILSSPQVDAQTKEPVRVFVLAGQSNMEGQAVVDLKGKDYNEGKGTLLSLQAQESWRDRVAHLLSEDGKGKVRQDVWVRYQRENSPLLVGPLNFGFSVYGDKHHFGPELQFGHVVGDALDEPVLIVKTAWGGKSLYRDFRPPSAGGETGKYYKLMVSQVAEALTVAGKEIPELQGREFRMSGFVWYHGWNDGVDPQTAVPEYESNLTHLIDDVRKEFKQPDLPVVIGELTGPWRDAPPEWERLRKAQANVAMNAELGKYVGFVPTRDYVRAAEDSPNPTHGHHEFGNAETYFLVGDALGKEMIRLLKLPRHEE